MFKGSHQERCVVVLLRTPPEGCALGHAGIVPHPKNGGK
jgi:hypothetical protein